jgi:hypothetical protein
MRGAVRAKTKAFIAGVLDRLKKYFSGKLALVQIIAGIGALAGRSLAVYAMQDSTTWNMVAASMVGSFSGYIGVYVIGYWLAFKRDYRTSGRTMAGDIFGLQLVEQSPNLGTILVSGVTQDALIGGTQMSPVLAANLGSIFGPQKIINLVAMLTSNTLKRACVDRNWRPLVASRNFILSIGRSIRS